jgi:hypothetical protein
MGRQTPGRRFGLELGIFGALVGAFLHRRSGGPLGVALFALGATILLLGIVRPSLLAPAARRWLAVGHRIAQVTTPVLLSIVYYGMITPMGLLRRSFSTSPLHRDRSTHSYWVRRPSRSDETKRAEMERQF